MGHGLLLRSGSLEEDGGSSVWQGRHADRLPALLTFGVQCVSCRGGVGRMSWRFEVGKRHDEVLPGGHAYILASY